MNLQLRKLLQNADKFLAIFALNSPKWLFIFLLRARVSLKSGLSSITWDSNLKCYSIKNNNFCMKFPRKSYGYQMYKNGLARRAQDFAEVYHLDLINFEENDLIVDCGAHIGDMYLYFQNKKLSVNYIGIEPLKKEFICLSENVKPNKAYNFALSNRNGIANFYIAKESYDSSLIKQNDKAEKTEIQSMTLDSLFSNQKIKLLKIEAEGAEPEILRGGIQVLSNTLYITIDVGPERGMNQESTLVEVVQILTANHFTLLSFNHSRFTMLFQNRNWR